ncbi:MAG: FAD/NAD(P)-binding protein [Candidatus Helarchaeota archaeon]
MLNLYLPKLCTIKNIIQENEANDLKTFELVFQNKSDEENFNYIPGQFAELSIIGIGECPIGIASSPTEKGSLKFTIKKVGTVTTAFHECHVGDEVGIRGPFGNGWPIDYLKGQNVVIVGGGFAFSTLRSLTEYILHKDNRRFYGDLTVIYGARNSGEMLYKEDLKRWQKRDDLNLVLTIDKPEPDWEYNVGYVPDIVKKVSPSSYNSTALVCGPPIMIKFSIPVLKELGFEDEKILLSLEMRMKCGVGKCGRCNIGNKFVCLDGPVFSQAELKALPKEY